MKTSKNTFLLINFLSTLVVAISVHAADNVIHPEPQEPDFLNASLYSALKRDLPRPPTPGSKQQALDEAELLKLQSIRTQQQCINAGNEVYVNLKNFFGGPGGLLSEGETHDLENFFNQVRNDGDYFIQRMKVDFPRKRPFLYVTGLKPCVPKEVTGAYPSGHATLSKLYALILGDLYPLRKNKFLIRADEIAANRVISGMHHPSDIEAGKQLGEQLYNALKISKKFKAQLPDHKKSIIHYFR